MDSQSEMRLQVIGRCRLLTKLGEGGMGLVFRGRHLDLDIDVAVKLLAAHLTAQPDMAQRFLREARLAARLNHPEIVRVYGCGEEQGYHYLIMEFVDGGSVQGYLDKKGPIPTSLALSIALSVARALGAASKEVGVIHRDIKPDNIMLTRDGKVKVADLGLAKMVDDAGSSSAALGGRTATGVAMGTPHYMAPEQFMDAKTVDHRADIFSLGATLYHMLVGSRPFDGDTLYAIMRKVVEEEPDPLPPSFSQEVRNIVSRMVAKKADDRYQNYDQLIADIEAVQPANSDARTLVDSSLAPVAAPEVVFSDLPMKSQASAGSVFALQSKAAEPISVPGPAPGSMSHRPSSGTAATMPQPPALRGKTAETLPFYDASGRRSWEVPLAVGLGVLALAGIVGVLVWALVLRNKTVEPVPTPVPVVVADPQPQEDPLEKEAEAFYRAQSDNLIAGRHDEVLRVIEATNKKFENTTWGAKIANLRASAQKSVAEKQGAVLIAKARLLRQDGKLNEAMDLLVEVLALVPESAEAKVALSEVREELAKVKEPPKEDPKAKVKPLLASARTLRETGLHQQAVEKLAQVLEIEPESVEAKEMLTQLREEMAAKKAAEERKDQFKKWMDEGLSLKLAGKFEQAEEAYKRAMQFAPPGSKIAERAAVDCVFERYRAVAIRNEAEGDFTAAIDNYVKALDVKQDADTRVRLESVKRKLEAKAEKDSELADAKRWKARGEEAEQQGKLRTALGFYREAAKAGADVEGRIEAVEAQMAYEERLANAEELVQQKKWEEADKLLSAILASRPKDKKASDLLREVKANEGPAQKMTLQLGPGVTMDLAYIKPGSFLMGSTGGNSDEQPVHRVTITKGFYMGMYEVTKAQYFRVTGIQPRIRLRDPNNPADNVSFKDAVNFCQKLSAMTSKRARLPSEAEWEYACRAGSSGRYSFGDSPVVFGLHGWSLQNAGRTTHPVGLKKPNAWGLLDMHGNICEWVSDWYDQGYYRKSPALDPTGPEEGEHRGLKGGSAFVDPGICAASTRYHYDTESRSPMIGLRVVIDASPQGKF